jgi:hypothetical protein
MAETTKEKHLGCSNLMMGGLEAIRLHAYRFSMLAAVSTRLP